MYVSCWWACLPPVPPSVQISNVYVSPLTQDPEVIRMLPDGVFETFVASLKFPSLMPYAIPVAFATDQIREMSVGSWLTAGVQTL